MASDQKLSEWCTRIFDGWFQRSGGHVAHSNASSEIVSLIVKTADWLEAATRMATEAQMGNGCATRHIVPNMNGAIETAKKLCAVSQRTDIEAKLVEHIENAVFNAHHGQSLGPWITREDQNRTYHDPCVDSN